MKGNTLDNIDLTPGQLQLVKGLLRKHLPDTEVWAYGSRVKFSSHPDSDLDMVAFATPEQESDVMLLREAFEESDLPFTVDFFIWDQVPDNFHKTIKREHFILQKVNDKVPAQKLPSRDRAGPRNPAPRQIMSNNQTPPNEWQPADLAQVAEIATGKSNSVDATECGSYPLFDRSQKVKRSNRFLFDTEAVIVPGEGANFIPRYFKGKFDLHQRAYAVIPSSKVNGRYMYYAILHGKEHFARVAVGSTVKSLRLRSFQSFPLLLPPIKEQRAIAYILGTLDDKIELNRQMSQTLESMAQTLFKSWFIDFDPVIDNALEAGNSIPEPLQAHATMRMSLNKSGSPLPPDLRTLFPSAFTHMDKLGWIPEGWRSHQVGEHVDITKGVSYRSQELAESTTALVTLKSFQRGGGYRQDGLKPYTGEYKQGQVIHPGELVMALTDVTQAADVVGKPALIPSQSTYERLVGSLDVAILRSRSGMFPRLLLYLLMMTPYFQHHARSYATGTTVLHLGVEGLSRYSFALPESEQLSQRFEQLVQPMFAHIQREVNQNESLGAVREALLPVLLSGKLRNLEEA